MKKFNILLVEDDDVDIMTVERAFEKANIVNPLFIAKNGLEALELLRSKKATTIVFVTGQGSEIIATQAIQSGAQNYFPKDKLKENGELFYKIVFAPSNLQYLEVLIRLQLLKKQTKFLEDRMNSCEKLT